MGLQQEGALGPAKEGGKGHVVYAWGCCLRLAVRRVGISRQVPQRLGAHRRPQRASGHLYRARARRQVQECVAVVGIPLRFSIFIVACMTRV